MKKHIGTRIITMLAVLLVIFGLNAALSSFSGQQSLGALRRITNIYMELEEANSVLIRSIEECKLYGNMIVYMTDEATATSMAQDVPNSIKKIDASFASMRQTCTTNNNAELLSLLDDYETEVQLMEEMITNVAQAYLSGDREGAAAANGGMYARVLAIQEKTDEFNEKLSSQSDALANERIQKSNDANAIAAALFVFYIVISVVMIIIVNRSVSRPARNASEHLSQIINKIDKNEGDLTERIHVSTEDEVGQLVKGVNNFIGQLQGIMQKIHGETTHMNELVSNITDGINNSNESANNVSATMEELSASMEEVAATMDQINIGAQEILTSSNEMSDKAKSGTEYIKEIKVRAEDVRELATGSKESTSRMLHDIRELLEEAIANSHSVEQINALTGDILNISSQTNLLALNASIEAARAGESGKGFAVVADEIRVLADNSRDTANNIQKISGVVTQAVDELAKNANDMLQFIDSTVLEDYDKFVDSANQYHADADNLDDILHDFYQRTQQLAETLASMTQGIDGINIAVDESAQGVTIAAQSTSELVDALSAIKTEADTNHEISIKLEGEVKRFKNI